MESKKYCSSCAFSNTHGDGITAFECKFINTLIRENYYTHPICPAYISYDFLKAQIKSESSVG
jgi:hypothetical protein